MIEIIVLILLCAVILLAWLLYETRQHLLSLQRTVKANTAAQIAINNSQIAINSNLTERTEALEGFLNFP